MVVIFKPWPIIDCYYYVLLCCVILHTLSLFLFFSSPSFGHGIHSFVHHLNLVEKKGQRFFFFFLFSLFFSSGESWDRRIDEWMNEWWWWWWWSNVNVLKKVSQRKGEKKAFHSVGWLVVFIYGIKTNNHYLSAIENKNWW